MYCHLKHEQNLQHIYYLKKLFAIYISFKFCYLFYLTNDKGRYYHRIIALNNYGRNSIKISICEE